MKKRLKKSKIYRTERLFVFQTSNDTFAIEGKIDGKRIRQRLKSLDEAKARCHSLEEGAKAETVTRTILRKDQIKDAEGAIRLLPSGVTFSEVAQFFIQNYKEAKTPLIDVICEYLRTKEDRSPATYQEVRNKLYRFSKWTGDRYLESITENDARCFLETIPAGSRNHFLRISKGLFRWACRRQMIHENPFEHIETTARQHQDVEVFTCHEAKCLLEEARRMFDGELLAYTAITVLAGLRPESEMKQLAWSAINFEDQEIRVTIGKTRTPRTVDMPCNLVAWLKLCNQATPIYPDNFRRKWAKVRNAAGFKGGAAHRQKDKDAEVGLKPWVKDVTRHSAISYRVRKTGDINTTATWAGNSPAIIRKHYLGLVSRSEAQSYYEIVPTTDAHILSAQAFCDRSPTRAS